MMTCSPTGLLEFCCCVDFDHQTGASLKSAPLYISYLLCNFSIEIIGKIVNVLSNGKVEIETKEGQLSNFDIKELEFVF